MGKKSIKENKNPYQLSREACELTREKASDLMEYVSPERIEKIESEKVLPHPDEVLAMSACYKNPELNNYFCTHECPIGQKYQPVIKLRDLSQITLETIAALNALEEEKNRLIEITVDGKISEDEKKDFEKIQNKLRDIQIAIRSMQMWVENAIMTGKIE